MYNIMMNITLWNCRKINIKNFWDKKLSLVHFNEDIAYLLPKELVLVATGMSRNWYSRQLKHAVARGSLPNERFTNFQRLQVRYSKRTKVLAGLNWTKNFSALASHICYTLAIFNHRKALLAWNSAKKIYSRRSKLEFWCFCKAFKIAKLHHSKNCVQ